MVKANLSDLQLELWLRKRDSLYWETRDGKQIPLKQMSTEHIVNALNYFKRAQEQKELMDIIYDDLRGLTMDDIC